MDVTAAYGKSKAPSFDEMQFYTMKFADFGFNDMTPQGIAKGYENLKKTSWSNQEKFMTNKLGFDASDPKLFKQGIEALSAWGLISQDHTNADGFYCQAT
jgi:hypothetical protein